MTPKENECRNEKKIELDVNIKTQLKQKQCDE